LAHQHVPLLQLSVVLVQQRVHLGTRRPALLQGACLQLLPTVALQDACCLARELLLLLLLLSVVSQLLPPLMVVEAAAQGLQGRQQQPQQPQQLPQ
jgi:hypothetical protein